MCHEGTGALSPFTGPEGGMDYSEEPLEELDDILRVLGREIRRYVVLSRAQHALLALWIVHTYVIDAAEATPYIWITGPERRVGKSRLLETLGLFVHSPLATANISVAALFRVVARNAPSL